MQYQSQTKSEKETEENKQTKKRKLYEYTKISVC